jgi:outer membrane protein OmpA-like peptidoglycan-associated protein
LGWVWVAGALALVVAGLLTAGLALPHSHTPHAAAVAATTTTHAPVGVQAAIQPPSNGPERPAPSADSAVTPVHQNLAANALPATVSATIPLGIDIVASNAGGEIESITDAYGPGHTGEALTDGSTQSAWQPDDGVTYPQELVFSFYKRDTALVSAVVVVSAKDGWGPESVDVSTSKSADAGSFTPVAAVGLADSVRVHAISFPPVEARYVKLRVDSGPAANVQIAEVEIIEAAAPGYRALLARHPEIATWKTSVRHAAQVGLDWLEPASMDWQRQNHCFGCHVQAQTLMGLSVARANDYVVSASAMRDLAVFTRSKQDSDGTEKDEGAETKFTPTQFAAMSMAYYDESMGVKIDSTLRRYVNWLSDHMHPNGELPLDMTEPPIAQGSLMSTANAVVAFVQAFAETGDTSYRQAADRGLAFIASAKPATTQDKVFKVIALSRYGSPEQRQIAAGVIRQLEAEQDDDGGWRERPGLHASNAFATGQALYAFQEAGVSITSPEFANGVRYLLATQERSGAWTPGETDAKRPSEFAPTMWAVIGLAGALEPPSVESMKTDLANYGRIILYVNFDFNKATLRPDAKPILTQVVKLLHDDPTLHLAINGHTDNVGTRGYNVQLSQRRAAAVMDALIAARVARDRLNSGGFGPDQPIADNDTEKGRAKNRRVELVKQ